MIDGFGPSGAQKSQRARSARNKGATAEREIVKRFTEVMFDIEHKLEQRGFEVHRHSTDIQRNSLQFGKGGFDIHGVPMLAIEVKRHETLACKSWFEQACRQAKQNELPVLIFRQSKQAWRVITWTACIGRYGQPLMWVKSEISYADFLRYYATMYEAFLLGS